MTAEQTQAIKEYSPTEAALAELRHKYDGVVFDVTTTKGDKEAREARQTLVKLRTGLEAERKRIKAPALEYAKRIDTEAARITAAIRELEEPIDKQIKTREAQVAAEKAEKERIERERVAAIQQKIAAIRELAVASTSDTAAELAETLAELEAFIPTPADFAELTADALVVRGAVIDTLKRMHASAVAREAEAARQAAERAELERQRREQEEREAKARAAQEEEARKLAEEREAFERQKAEFEAQQRAAQQPQELEAIEASAAPLPAAVLDLMPAPVAAAMKQPADAGTWAACKGHSWLIEDGMDGSQPCPECADEQARIEATAGMAVVKYRVGGESSFATLVQTSHATSCGGDERLAIERHRAFFMEHLADLHFEKVEELSRTYTADDIRAAFIAGWECTSTDLARAASAYVASLEG